LRQQLLWQKGMRVYVGIPMRIYSLITLGLGGNENELYVSVGQVRSEIPSIQQKKILSCPRQPLCG
jgi:hypothetical protein